MKIADIKEGMTLIAVTDTIDAARQHIRKGALLKGEDVLNWTSSAPALLVGESLSAVEPLIRTGDVVIYHDPKDRYPDEEWLVAYADYETGYLCAAGWPDGEVPIDQCILKEAASDESRAAFLDKLLGSSDRRGKRALAIEERYAQQDGRPARSLGIAEALSVGAVPDPRAPTPIKPHLMGWQNRLRRVVGQIRKGLPVAALVDAYGDDPAIDGFAAASKAFADDIEIALAAAESK